MESFEIEGSGQIRFNGVTHALDKDGKTFCGETSQENRLFNDKWPGGADFLVDVTCKKCLRKFWIGS